MYECTTDITVYAYDFIGQKMDIAAAQIVPEGCLFNIVDAFPPDTLSLKSRVCVIKLSNKTTNLSQRYQARTIISANNAVYYVMKMSDILYKVRKKYDKVLTPTVGVAFVPIKIRLKLTENDRFDFSQDIMLGTSIGLRKRIDAYLPYYQTSLLSIGITSVVADSATTKGYIKEGNTKLAAFTPSLALLTVPIGCNALVPVRSRGSARVRFPVRRDKI